MYTGYINYDLFLNIVFQVAKAKGRSLILVFTLTLGIRRVFVEVESTTLDILECWFYR